MTPAALGTLQSFWPLFPFWRRCSGLGGMPKGPPIPEVCGSGRESRGREEGVSAAAAAAAWTPGASALGSGSNWRRRTRPQGQTSQTGPTQPGPGEASPKQREPEAERGAGHRDISKKRPVSRG